MSTAAPAGSICTRYCGKHPQERVVGVCSACLANKLSSLIYTSTASAPENFDNIRMCSPLGDSPPGSINSPSNPHHPHLQTINEEADSPAQEISNEGLLGSALEVPFTAAVEVCAEAELVGNTLTHCGDQISLACNVVHSIEEGKPIINNQDTSLISEIVSSINEEVRPIDLEEGKPKANPYLRANKPIKCKRSKSLCGLRGESLIKLEQEAHEYESAGKRKGEQSNTGAKKVTLQALFQLDDEEKWRNRALMAPHTSESELGIHRLSADYKPIEEEFDRGSSCDAKQTEEAKDVHDHNSHRCVPSASTISSSVCPSMPSKLKHSVLLNSLLCRKTGDEKKGSGSMRKSPQVNETSRTIFIRSFKEGGVTQESDEGGLIRATYIGSDSRESLRRCRSKLERSVARTSVSSSQPSSPPCVSHLIDVKSERKFNLTARVLAAELPSMLRSSAETSEAMMMIRSKSENSSVSATQTEDCKEGQDLRLGAHNDSVTVGTTGVPTRLQSSKTEANPASLMVLGQQEEHYLAHAIPNAAEGDETLNGSFSGDRKAQDDEEVELVEMPQSKADVKFVSISRRLDTTEMISVRTRGNLEEAHDSFCADAAHEEAAGESENRVPTHITVSQEVRMAAGCRSLSSGKSIAAAGQQGSQKLAEEWKNGGGVWEAYSNKSGKGGRQWPPSGKIAPAQAQSGLLRFYLTPLRASGRPRFTSTRRPPRRHFWSLIFI